MKNLWTFSGKIGRAEYATWGLSLMALKFLIDWAISAGFGQPWSPLFYLSPGRGLENLDVIGEGYYLTMNLVSVPFLWVGMALTFRRLRSAGWSVLCTFLFLVPVVNLAFFVGLMLREEVPEKAAVEPEEQEGEKRDVLDGLIPVSPMGAASVTIVIAILFSLPVVVFASSTLEVYGWSLFLLLPFSIGVISSLVWGYREERSLSSSMGVSTLACLLPCAGMLVAGIEGVLCIAMSVPIALPASFLGAIVGRIVIKSWRTQRENVSYAIAPLLLLPAFIGVEKAAMPEPSIESVSTVIEIDAPIERVWQNVVDFGEIDEPEEWIFRMGIAAPVRAEITGSGVGAVRHCVFTTGTFVEPITVWDEPELLGFSVEQTPPAMREWSPFGDIDTSHLEGNFVAVRGEFRLETLADGTTRLVGTTWYQQHLWPAAYWRLWTDQMVHAIHLRVLNHIRRLSES